MNFKDDDCEFSVVLMHFVWIGERKTHWEHCSTGEGVSSGKADNVTRTSEHTTSFIGRSDIWTDLEEQTVPP